MESISNAIKDDTNKVKYSSMPVDVLYDVAKSFSFGANKYGLYNYSKGMEWCRFIDASLRHITAFQMNEDIDLESGNHHIDHAIASLMMLKHNINQGIGIDNRNKIIKVKYE